MVSEKKNEGGGIGSSVAVIAPSWTCEPDPSKVHWRPPVYNAEDYLGGLARRPQAPTPHPHEMSLRQFQTTSDLLAKLATDLKHAYPSFVQEFVAGDGPGLLLEVLRSVQVGQKPVARRQNLRDELHCLQAVQGCLRSQDTVRRLAASSSGLFTLAACIMSNVNKSRVLALEILRKTCYEGGGKGHSGVSDAMSTMRLRFGEPVRFRFLCGMLGGACPQLLLAGLAFINSLVESAPSVQARLYLQAELDQAGFNPQHFAKTLKTKSPYAEELRVELRRWYQMFVDVNKLKARENQLTKEVSTLKDKLYLLEKRLQVLQEEKSVASSTEVRLKSRCEELERQVTSLRGVGVGHASTPAEDEGISSSGQDEREPWYNHTTTLSIDNKQDEEATIEEVMEELQNIINDAESDYNSKSGVSNEREERRLAQQYTRYMQRSSNDLSIPSYELEIIPDKILPQPPRRTRSLYLDREYRYSMFFEDEDSADNSDSMLSTPTNEPTVMSYDERVAKTQKDKEQPKIEHVVVKESKETAVIKNSVLDQRDIKRRGAILAKEAQKNFVKRRETFHNPSHQPTKPVSPSEILPEIKLRRGSFDGLFIRDNGSSSGSRPSSKNSTKIYIEHDQSRIKSRNSDRTEDNHSENKHHSPYSTTIIGKRNEESGRYSSERTVFLPIRNDPSPPATQRLVVKRSSQANAGLYSGQGAPSCRVNSSEYYSRSLAQANLTVSPGKLSDLPSGLY